MRVLVVSQYYAPEDHAYAQTVAQGLAKRGNSVRVLTGYPNYPEGRLFEGYTQKLRSYEKDGAVNVLRVPLYVDHSQDALKRSLNYLSFAASSATARRFARGADVVYVYATQMTPAFGPWLGRLVVGRPYVLHVQDLWPDSITGSSLIPGRFKSRAVAAVLNPWMRSVYRHASATIGIAPTMVETLIERGAPRDRAHLVYNFGDEESPNGHKPRSARTNGGVRIVYAGNVGVMQDLEHAVQAAHRTKDAGVQLTIVGDGVALPDVRAHAARIGATNVHFRDPVPFAQIGEIYDDADYALVTLKDLPVFRGTIPSKFQDALSYGMPVISTVQGDLRGLVEELGVGFTADAENPASLAEAFRAAAAASDDERNQHLERSRTAYAENFSLKSGMDSIERILRVAAKDGRKR
ncbi:MAG TPA: glycosyltransferase family 4 protein [Actinomycetaceae bacterium]|nr:glycosyltransferase family 4 protein [Actinomycetaceae bacterium]